LNSTQQQKVTLGLGIDPQVVLGPFIHSFTTMIDERVDDARRAARRPFNVAADEL